MKQAVVVLAALSLIAVYVQSASVGVNKHVEKVASVDGDNHSVGEKPADGEIHLENLMSGGRHRQKRYFKIIEKSVAWVRNKVCSEICGDEGGTCTYRPGYTGSRSCGTDKVCVCN